jgi:hypothetical protein
MERKSVPAECAFSNQECETGGPRSWVISEVCNAITVGVVSLQSCPWVPMPRTLDETFRAVGGETSARKFRYGQLGALVRKPSPSKDIEQ